MKCFTQVEVKPSDIYTQESAASLHAYLMKWGYIVIGFRVPTYSDDHFIGVTPEGSFPDYPAYNGSPEMKVPHLIVKKVEVNGIWE